MPHGLCRFELEVKPSTVLRHDLWMATQCMIMMAESFGFVADQFFPDGSIPGWKYSRMDISPNACQRKRDLKCHVDK